MPVEIDPHSIVSREAILDEDVKVGPFSVIEGKAKIGKGTKILQNCYIGSGVTIGEKCEIFASAVIGSPPQDLKYSDAESFIEIGPSNIIREFVTINPGTEQGSKTTIGKGNLIMAYSHIAHNCVVGDGCILANAATLAGHVELGSKVVIGGLVAVHQFCRLGDFSIIGGCSKVVQDVPPYSMCDGHPAKVYGINLVGLKRGGFSSAKIKIIKEAFRILFFSRHSLNTAVRAVKDKFPDVEEISRLTDFIGSSSRGICR